MPRGGLGRIRSPLLVTLGASCITQKGRVFNTAYVTPNDVFAVDLAPTNTPTCFRVIVAVDATAILQVRRTGTIGTVQTEANQGAALTADAEYAFDFYMTTEETLNIRFSANCNILYLLVIETPTLVS